MAKKSVQEVLKQIQTLPPLPAAVEKLCRMVDDPDASVHSMVRVISMDAALTARLLRVANSAFYGFTGKIQTISRAVMVLGGHQIRSIALGIAIFGVRLNPKAKLPLQREAFWRHALSVGVAIQCA